MVLDPERFPKRYRAVRVSRYINIGKNILLLLYFKLAKTSPALRAPSPDQERVGVRKKSIIYTILNAKWNYYYEIYEKCKLLQ
jgi:hypothetical protein